MRGVLRWASPRNANWLVAGQHDCQSLPCLRQEAREGKGKCKPSDGRLLEAGTRVATSSGDHGSIESQLAELRSLAQKEGIIIKHEFTEAMTAKEPGRPIFNQMITLMENGEANGIISWHPDRLARNSVDGGRIVWLLDTKHIEFLKFPQFWFENTPQGKFMLNIAFGQSKYYVDNLSENVKRGHRQKLRHR